MQFEKLNENKIRIILNHKDLEAKNIDFHTFMSNPIQSQDLFLDMLNEAERQIGFNTKNYQIKIEALAMSSGDFVLTITRSAPETVSTGSIYRTNTKKKLKVKRKNNMPTSTQAVYSFNCYDDFYYFMKFVKHQNINLKSVAKNITVYEYKNTYYIAFKNINLNLPLTKNFYSLITEFGVYVNNSNLFINKLAESGNIVLKNSTIDNYISLIPNN